MSGERTAELEAFLARARVSLRATRDWSSAREARLVQRVLRRTTRADPSWRGDLAVLARFLRERLRESAALRVVAASLLLQALALPVLAYLMAAERRERGFLVHVELPRESPFDDRPPAEEGTALDELAASARLCEARENALLRARFVLQTRGARAPGGESAGSDPLELRLLAARGGGLRQGRWPAWLDDPRGLEEASPLALALWGECLLDRFVQTGTLGAAWEGLLTRLERAALAPGDSGRLVRATRERAALHGLAQPSGASESTGRADPLRAGWFDELGRASRERRLDGHPLLRAWIDWGGR